MLTAKGKLSIGVVASENSQSSGLISRRTGRASSAARRGSAERAPHRRRGRRHGRAHWRRELPAHYRILAVASDAFGIMFRDACPRTEHARPCEFRDLALVRVWPLLVHKAVFRPVAENLGRFSRTLERRFEVVDRLRRAPVILVGKMALERHADVSGLGDICRRNAVKALRKLDALLAFSTGQSESVPHHRPPPQQITLERRNHCSRKPSTAFATKSAISGL